MAGSTSGGISDLAFVMNMRIDESSVTDSMRTLGDMKSKMSTATFSAIDSGGSTSSQDIADTKFAEAQQHVAQLDAAYEASEQQRLAAIQAQEDANEAAFAAMLQHVAQLDAAQEAAEQQRLAAEQALADAAETEFAAMLQHVAQLDAAEEAAEQQRLNAVNAEIDAIEGDMTRALRRTLNIEDQINFDYQRRLEAIDAIQGATAQQTAELRLQAAAVRDAARQTAINAGQIGGIGAAGLTGNRIQEIGRGFEDFTVGFSMAKTNIEGVAMGLRGSANNAAQLAASFNPMVGATVAIGASLATVIVPMVARWLFDSKELERSAERHKKMLEEMGQDEIKRAKDIAEFRQGGQKTADDPVSKLEALDKKKQESILNAAELRRQLAVAEQQLDQTTFDKQQALWEQGEAIRSGDLAGFGRARGRSADAAGRNEMAEKKRDEIQKALAEEEQAMLAAGRTEKEIKERFGKEIDTAKANRADAEWAKIREEEDKKAAVIMERLDKQNDKAEKDGMKRIEEEFREEQANIDALNVHEDTTKKATAANKASRDAKIAKEQEKRDIKAIDAELQANADQQDALQERMQNAGNAAGPSAAMVSGTQAAESAINRALSGSQSVEGTMKSQLKVLQEIHKDLQKQKQAKTVSL